MSNTHITEVLNSRKDICNNNFIIIVPDEPNLHGGGGELAHHLTSAAGCQVEPILYPAGESFGLFFRQLSPSVLLGFGANFIVDKFG
jgi:hypothetical protein